MLTIDGDLDATLGMTLDAVLGNSNASNNRLDVTGTATISGDLDLFLEAGVSSTSYQAGYAFTVLTADGGLFSQFSNLPAGYYDSTTWESLGLPTLHTGLEWEVEYTGSSSANGDPANSVILKVVRYQVLPTGCALAISGIADSSTRIDVGTNGNSQEGYLQTTFSNNSLAAQMRLPGAAPLPQPASSAPTLPMTSRPAETSSSMTTFSSSPKSSTTNCASPSSTTRTAPGTTSECPGHSPTALSCSTASKPTRPAILPSP